ncbi:DUF4175 domain-containing protein [Neolewinella lacunae]|uniref:DUF4175 domain-containing protein n=1 Tax=Neolewinella lacunae TaxID=1517758 RepID=A0A923PQY9_9BACT|nr:DUF4175 family protein [Neolewinella lacunae]MBC6995838.1 DUF4175 domain-containing protein [Neolewinella lacunae]MDN3636469.1 DUF4175 domain-containing protein [Neolewinella lacunae]
MPQVSHHYDQLITKLDEFIRKYYINGVIRGLLYTVGLVLALFLLVSLLESQFYFGTAARKLMFYGFVGLSLLAFGGWVLLPLARYFRLGQVISHEKAADIIGKHFTNVKDKLLNVLQLRRQADEAADTSLLLASIDQKSAEISPVPFRSAIDLSQNRRYLKFALPPLLLLIVLLFAAPSLIKDSTNRLLRNNDTFTRPAPFTFTLENNPDLEVIQYGDFPLTVKVEGDVLPAEAYIEVDGYRYRLQKENANTFTYLFSNVQEDTPFALSAGPVESPEFTLAVLPKPNIAAFTVALDYPAYLGRQDEELANIGDLTVPAGTQIKWSFDTENTDHVDLRFTNENTVTEMRRDGSNLYSFDKRALKNDRYTLYIGNERLPLADSVSYSLAVIPDLYPQISVETFRDSTDEKLLFFAGEASDDYGVSKINFVYRLTDGETGAEGEEQRLAISGPAGKQTRYDHVWDLASDLALKPGDELSYYFEVYDNDGVNGAKSARTGVMAFRNPSKEELEEQAESNDNKIKDELKKALEATKDLKQDTKELREKMLQEKELDWKMRKELEKLAERQQEVQKQINEAQEAFEENLKNEQESQQDEQILQKQEQLQKMFEESIDQEMQELMQQIQELMQELEKDEALKKMEDMELSDEQTEAELDRMLELFKQLELEKDMKDAIEKLEELAEEEEKLAEETEKGDTPQEELQEKQQEIKEEFEALQEKMEQMEEKNEALEKPMELDTQEESQEEVKEEMEKAGQDLKKQDNKGAAQKQKKASKKMKEMAESMDAMMQSMQQEQAEEDMDALRQLLENIVDLSFDQEEVMDQLNRTTVNTPRYVELVQNQFKINNDFELVRDSLNALAKRNFQIETFITEKVTEIKGNLASSIDELEERHTPQAANLQQRAMTGLNDLALMLNESMENMQQQMAGMMAGDQQCENPGEGKGNKPGKPSSNPGSDGQRSLNDAMEGMKEGLEKAKDGKDGKGGSAKEFAEMAARQAALRKALEAKQKARQQEGKGTDPALQELIDQMNEAEEDLVNKRLTNEMMNRQQDILSKMLDHERAEREQEMDEKRKSETAQQRRREIPPSLEAYLKQRKAEIEMFKRVTPELNPYFQGLVDEYFRSLRGE